MKAKIKSSVEDQVYDHLEYEVHMAQRLQVERQVWYAIWETRPDVISTCGDSLDMVLERGLP